jgi:type I restriction enzyme S subunit
MTPSLNKNIPKLRFPEYKGAWDKKKFDEIFTFSTGKNIKQNEASPEFDIPCVRYGELYHMYNEVINEIINKTNLDKSELLFSEGDEIILPSAGEDPLDIGSASALTIKNVAIGRTINILKPAKPNIYSQVFASYYINHKLKKDISKLAKGVSISNVYNSDLKTLFLNLPTLPEQTKIASFLSSVDKKLTQLKQKKVLLEQYKKGVMQKLFSQELRFKPDPTEALDDENGKEFPDWEEKKLGEIGAFQTSSIDKLSKVNEKEVFLVNYMNVYRHENVNNETIKSFQVVTAKDHQIESCNLKKGDILFTPSSETPDDIGHSVVIFEDLENAVFSYHLMRFRPNIKIDILYSHYFCNISSVLKQLTKLATGSTRFTISVRSFSSVEISLPCLKEQTKIAHFLSAIDEKINHCQLQIEKTENWKKGLLQQLFV